MSMSTHRTNTAVENHQDISRYGKTFWKQKLAGRRCITYHLVDLGPGFSRIQFGSIRYAPKLEPVVHKYQHWIMLKNLWLIFRHFVISLYLYISLTFTYCTCTKIFSSSTMQIVSMVVHSHRIHVCYILYGNIYHQYTPNVSIYTIHGSYGIVDISQSQYLHGFPARSLWHPMTFGQWLDLHHKLVGDANLEKIRGKAWPITRGKMTHNKNVRSNR